MELEIKTWLYDILNAIMEIDSFLIDSRDFELYTKDIRTKRAVERNIEIIGEAMNRILKKNSAINLSDSRKIVEVRNRIIHGYDTVSDEIIWSIVNNKLSILQNEIETLLKE